MVVPKISLAQNRKLPTISIAPQIAAPTPILVILPFLITSITSILNYYEVRQASLHDCVVGQKIFNF